MYAVSCSSFLSPVLELQFYLPAHEQGTCLVKRGHGFWAESSGSSEIRRMKMRTAWQPVDSRDRTRFDFEPATASESLVSRKLPNQLDFTLSVGFAIRVKDIVMPRIWLAEDRHLPGGPRILGLRFAIHQSPAICRNAFLS